MAIVYCRNIAVGESTCFRDLHKAEISSLSWLVNVKGFDHGKRKANELCVYWPVLDGGGLGSLGVKEKVNVNCCIAQYPVLGTSNIIYNFAPW